MKKIIIFLISFLLIIFIIIMGIIASLKGNNGQVNENDISEDVNQYNKSREIEKYDLLNVTNSNSEDEIMITEDPEFEETVYGEVAGALSNDNFFYTVQSCLQNYMESINRLIESDNYNEQLKVIYDKMSTNYRKNLNVHNLEEHMGLKKGSSLINILDVLQLNIKDNNSIRFILRAVFVDEEGKPYYFNCIVYLDYKNFTYAIEPIDNSITNLTEVNLKNEINQIEKNDNNGFKYVSKTEEKQVKNYFERMTLMFFNTPEIAFEYLDEAYRTNKFGNVDNLKSYIEENRHFIENMIIEKIDEKEEDGYIKYICTDIAGKYYTLKVTDITHFTFQFGAVL